MTFPDVKVTTKEDVARWSFQYQKEWRFEKEKKLIMHALTLFPDWKYLQDRLEWHSRPLFHKDPDKSKMQPRKPLHLPRDPQYTPSAQTIQNLCFVTGASSNPPYFDLVVQLIESLKATRFYKDVAIKVLDCGLTQDDIDYLKTRFNAEVKDPGWDVDVSLLEESSSTLPIQKNGFKGIMARPYLHQHFPGYQYYFWLDADMWIQDERGLDRLLSLAQRQGFGVVIETGSPFIQKHCFLQSLHQTYHSAELLNRHLIFGGFFCFRHDVMEQFHDFSKTNIQKVAKYKWGNDMICLSYLLYTHYAKGQFESQSRFRDLVFQFKLNDDKSLKDQYFINILWEFKFLPYRAFFSNSDLRHHQIQLYKKSKILLKEDNEESEETAHQLCQKNGWKLGGYFWRIYPDPYDVYGSIQNVI